MDSGLITAKRLILLDLVGHQLRACRQQEKTIDAPSLITKAREHERIYEFIRVSLLVFWAFRDHFMLARGGPAIESFGTSASTWNRLRANGNCIGEHLVRIICPKRVRHEFRRLIARFDPIVGLQQVCRDVLGATDSIAVDIDNLIASTKPCLCC